MASCYDADMVALVFYVWLLGAILIFVAVAVSGKAEDRFEGLWLLVLAAAWPFVVAFVLVGTAATLIGMLISLNR